MLLLYVCMCISLINCDLAKFTITLVLRLLDLQFSLYISIYLYIMVISFKFFIEMFYPIVYNIILILMYNINRHMREENFLLKKDSIYSLLLFTFII